MQKAIKCQLCQNDCYEDAKGSGITRIRCNICGQYEITDSFEDYIHLAGEKLYLISGVTRRYYEHKAGTFRVTERLLTDEVEFQAKILSVAPKSVLDKAALLLQYIDRKSSHPGDNVSINPSQDYPICFCKNEKELRFYIHHLRDIGDIKAEGTMRDYSLSLTAEGWRKVESLAKPNIQSKQAFVAMWFDESMDEIFKNGIVSIENDTGFSMFRVDKTHFINEKICDKIIAEIKKSRFLICDVTGQRQAVYFEAGYAMGMGLPVIWTCKESEVNACCFDTRQYPHIIWKDAEDLRNQLKEKILATIGKTRN